MLTILKTAGNKPTYKSKVRCLCSCGKEVTVVYGNILSGNTKSCGCLKYINRGIKTFGYANANSAYFSCKSGAIRRGLEFEISLEEFIDVSQKPCVYCGRSGLNKSELKHRDGSPRCNGPFIYTGIDRVDSRFGYMATNIVPCCFQCNFAKAENTVHEFYAFVQRVYEHLKLGVE